MKKTSFLLFAITLTTYCQAQVFVGLGAGASTNKSAIVELNAGYDFKLAFLQIGFLSSPTSDITKGTVFNVRIGHGIAVSDKISIEPSAGYGVIYRSNDKPYLNSRGLISSLYGIKKISDLTYLFIGVNYINNITSACIGIRMKMLK